MKNKRKIKRNIKISKEHNAMAGGSGWATSHGDPYCTYGQYNTVGNFYINDKGKECIIIFAMQKQKFTNCGTFYIKNRKSINNLFYRIITTTNNMIV